MSKEANSADNNFPEVDFYFEYNDLHRSLLGKTGQNIIAEILRKINIIEKSNKTLDDPGYILKKISLLNLYEIALGVSSESGARIEKKDKTSFNLHYENKANYEKFLKLSAEATANVNKLLKEAQNTNEATYNYFKGFFEDDEIKSYSYLIMKRRIYTALNDKVSFKDALTFCENNGLYIHLAISDLRENNYHWARIYADYAIKNNQNIDLAYHITGQCYLKENNKEKAKEVFLYSFRNHKNFYALLDYYRCLKDENINEAAKIFIDYKNEIAEIKDKALIAEFYYEKGLLCEKSKEDEQAYEHFRTALLNNPQSKQIKFAIIKCMLYGKGCNQNVANGMIMLTNLAEKGYFNALVLKADIYENGIKKKSAQAAAAESEEYAIEPRTNQNPDEIIALCNVYYAPAYEKMAQAFKVGNFTLAKNLKNSLSSFINAATIYRKENDLESFAKVKNEILDILRENISLNNYNYDNREQITRDLYLAMRYLKMPEAEYFYAQFLQRTNGNQDEIVQHYQDSVNVQSGPRSIFAAQAYYELGIIYSHKNEPKTALKYFDRAIALNQEYSNDSNLADARLRLIERRAGIVARQVVEGVVERYVRESQPKIKLPTTPVDYGYLIGWKAASNNKRKTNPEATETVTETAHVRKPPSNKTNYYNGDSANETKAAATPTNSTQQKNRPPHNQNRIARIIAENREAHKDLNKRLAKFEANTREKATKPQTTQQNQAPSFADYFWHYQQNRDILSKYKVIDYLAKNHRSFEEIFWHVEELLTTYNTTAQLTQEHLADFTKLLSEIFDFKVQHDLASYYALSEDVTKILATLNFVELTKNTLLQTQPQMDQEKAKIFDEAHLQLRKTLNKAIEEINFTRSFNNIADDRQNLEFQQHMAHKGIAASQYYCALAYKNGIPAIGLEAHKFLSNSYFKDLLSNKDFKDSVSYDKAEKYYAQKKPSQTSEAVGYEKLGTNLAKTI